MAATTMKQIEGTIVEFFDNVDGTYDQMVNASYHRMREYEQKKRNEQARNRRYSTGNYSKWFLET